MRSRLTLLCSSVLLLCCLPGSAQGGDVTAKFAVAARPGATAHKNARHAEMKDIALWLTRVDDGTPARPVPATGTTPTTWDRSSG